jgi:hypothetical protein
MKTLLIGASLAAALAAGQALAEDNEAGVPLSPAEAAGAWMVSTGGRDICTITLTAAHGVKAGACNGLLPSPTGWRATADGMALTGAGGQLGFHRWSNSLFVSRRDSGVDIQLRRGGPVLLGREPEG